MNIFQAVNNNDIKQVTKLLHKNSDLVNKRRNGEFPLHLASERGYVDIVKILIQNNAKIDAVDLNGWTPFFLACSNGHYTTVLELLDYKADPTHKCRVGDTPLHAACRHGSMSVIKYLFNFHIEIDGQNTDGWTPLHRATYSGHIDAVSFLINEGADVTVKTNTGKTAFDLALSLRNDMMAETITYYGTLQDRRKLERQHNNDRYNQLNGRDQNNDDKSVIKTFLEIKRKQLAELLKREKTQQDNNSTNSSPTTPSSDLDEPITIRLGEVGHIMPSEEVENNTNSIVSETNNTIAAETTNNRTSEDTDNVPVDANRSNGALRTSNSRPGRELDVQRAPLEPPVPTGEGNESESETSEINHSTSPVPSTSMKLNTDISNHLKSTYESLCSFFKRSERGETLEAIEHTSEVNEGDGTEAATENTETATSGPNIEDPSEHECPLCLDIPLPPVHIYQCSNGHLYCGNCKDMPNMTKCPQCNINISGVANRNRYAEENIAKIYGKKNGS